MAAADDALDSVSSHTIDILRVASGMRAAVIARLIDLEGELSSTLARAEDLSANKYAKLNALLKQTTAQIIDAYSQIDGVTKDDLKQLATLEGKQAVKIINGIIGADVVSVALSPKQLEAIVDAPVIFGNSSSKWWEAQAEDLRAKFAQQMQQGLLLGEGIDELARRVRGTKANGFADGIMEKKKREADALVRSSVISTANEARLRTMSEMSDLVKGIQWVSTLDNRTTPICRALDGKVWRLPDFEPVGHDKKWPGPTAHWNCFTGDVPVSSPAGVRRFYRRPYSGELLTVETDNGRRITATPNHPVLTRDGWKPVGELKAGDELICQKGRGGRVPAGSPQDQSEQASFAEFGQTFAEFDSVFAVQVPVTGPDFHGDVAGAEVCEVWTDRRLCGEDDAALAQLSGKPLLDDGNLDSPVGLTCEGGTLKAFASANGTADGSMGRGDVRTLAASPSRMKIITPTAGNASGDAPSPESVQADSILPGDFSGREFVGDVESDRVRMIVRREAVSVLVHNLETETGWYLADGIVAHNCRSTQIPVLRSWEELSGKKLPSIGKDELQARLEEKLAARGWTPEKIAQAKANTRASMDGQEAKETTFDDWMGKKGPAAVDRLLGPGRAKLWKEGKVTVSDLTNQNNRPLTLAQLANKIERGIPAPETLGQDFLPLPAKPKAARPAPAMSPELSPEDATAKQKLADAAATKLHQKIVGEVMAANPDASPAVQWAVVEAMIRVREIAGILNDAAAEKVIAGTMPAKVKKTLDSLANDDPARAAWADKLELAQAKKREVLKSALPDADLEEIASALARDGMIANKGLKSLWAVVSKEEASQVQTRVAELKAEKSAAAQTPAATVAAAVTALPAVLPPTPERKKPVSFSVKGEIPESIRPAMEYAFNAMARAHDDGELPKIEVTDKRSTGIRKSDRGAYVREGWKSILVFLDPDAKHKEWTGVHEFGHFMHHQVLGDDPEWSDGRGKASPEAAKLKKILEATTGVKELKKAAKAQKNVVIADWKYLADYREVFARAYGQWLATKLRDPLLLAGLEADRQSVHGKKSQWSDEEFVPIAAAFDSLFAAKGWL